MSEKQKRTRVSFIVGKTQEALARFSYLNAHVPKRNRESGKDECSVTLLIPENSPEVKEISKIIDDIIQKDFVAQKKPYNAAKFWNPLRDPRKDVKNNGQPYGPETKGFYVLSCKTGNDATTGEVILPDVVGTTKDAENKYIRLSAKEIKSGDWGRASVTFVPFEKNGGGVSCYFSKLQLVKQGESLGAGQTSAEDDFSAFDDGSENCLD